MYAKCHTQISNCQKRALSQQASIYFFKVSHGKTRIVCKLCSKLTTETPEQRPFMKLNRFQILYWYFHC